MPTETLEKIRLDSLFNLKPERTPEGFLKVAATVTRAGIFEYRNADGSIRRELRRPEQVFRADSMASLQGCIFVDGHPYAYGGKVTPHNARRLTRGFTCSPAYKTENNLNVDVMVTDEEALKEIEAGRKFLSAGYTCKFTGQGGEWEGQRFDDEQTDIKYNHVALVRKDKKPRAGESALLHLDEDLNEIPPQENAMPDLVTLKLDDGRNVEVAPDVAAAFNRVQEKATRADTAEELYLETEAKLQTVTGERDGMKTKLDSMDATIKSEVKVRTGLLAQATTILPKTEHARLDEASNIQIMGAIIRHAAGQPDLKLDEASADYIRGRYESVVALAPKKNVSAGRELGRKINQTRADEGSEPEDGKDEGMTPEELREAKKKKLTERYRKPIGKKKKSREEED